VNELAERGHRVIAVAAGPSDSLQLAGLIAVSDPPREDSAMFVGALRELGVRTVMVTGDSPVTATAIATKVDIDGEVCPPDRPFDELHAEEFGVFARVVPEEKFRLVQALQRTRHVVGMCGDGTNDAPALRQAQIGIAVSTATDVAKAAAGVVLTEPGLAGIVFAVRDCVPAAADLHVQHADQEDRDRTFPGHRARPHRPCGDDTRVDGLDAGDERLPRHVAHHGPCESLAITERMAHARHYRRRHRPRPL
jgi:hypothetical protein